MTYLKLVKGVSEKLGLSEKIVRNAYRAYWSYIRQAIGNLPLKDPISEEEFDSYKTSLNIPSLGKFVTSFEKIKGVRKKLEILKNLREKNTSHVES